VLRFKIRESKEANDEYGKFGKLGSANISIFPVQKPEERGFSFIQEMNAPIP
jgi:hypothetical protein